MEATFVSSASFICVRRWTSRGARESALCHPGRLNRRRKLDEKRGRNANMLTFKKQSVIFDRGSNLKSICAAACTGF